MDRKVELKQGLQSLFHHKKISKIWKKDAIFCATIIIPMVVHWVMMGFVLQVDSIFQSFKEYNPLTGEYTFLPKGHLFDNYKRWFNMVFNDPIVAVFILRGYLFSLIGFASGFLNIFVCFVIARKCPLHNFFVNILLIPGIVGSFTLLVIFQFFVEKGLPVYMLDLFGKTIPTDLITNENTSLVTNMIYGLFIGFPGSLLTYVGMLNRIPDDLIDYGRLEGITFWGEFKYLAWPTIYPMWYLTNLGIFISGLSYMGPGFELFGADAYSHGLATFSYHIYVLTRYGENGIEEANYCFSAASGMIMAFVGIIGVVIGRKILSRGDKEVIF